jgi:hypothetical protein
MKRRVYEGAVHRRLDGALGVLERCEVVPNAWDRRFGLPFARPERSGLTTIITRSWSQRSHVRLKFMPMQSGS